jgi:hypothetical protein
MATSPSITTCDCTMVFIADCHLRPNNRKRTDPHIRADFRIRIDDCGGMNFASVMFRVLEFEPRISVITTRLPL